MQAEGISGLLGRRVEQMQKDLAKESGIFVCFLPAGSNLPLGGKELSAEALGASCELGKKALAANSVQLCQSGQGLWRAALPVGKGAGLQGAWLLEGFQLVNGQDGPYQEGIPLFNRQSLDILLKHLTVLGEELCASLNQKNAAFVDLLLGIPNQLALDREIKSGTGKFLIVLDIQDLRKINDLYGRELGDKLLKNICSYLLSLEIPEAELYRSNVADFALVLKNSNQAEAFLLAEKLAQRCKEAWLLKGKKREQKVFAPAKIGILPLARQAKSILPNLTSAIEHTLDLASKCHSVVLFDEEENAALLERLHLELALSSAVQNNMQGFFLKYQPIIDPGTALWVGLEALCRWESPGLAKIPPHNFISVAKASGLIYPIGQWTLKEALQNVKNWQLVEKPNFQLHVNISSLQLLNPEFYSDVQALLVSLDYPPEKLCLEITESSQLNVDQHSLNTVNKLAELGVVIALDDFVASYAGLHTLHKLPARLVKFDRAVVGNVENDYFLQQFFRVLAEIAHALDMQIVAEGVENSTQALFLLKSGADFFQGSYFSPSLQAEQVEELLENFKSPVSEVVHLGYGQLDLSRLSDEQGGYELSFQLYKLLARCMQVLFSAQDGDEAINTALAEIGRGLGVSRSYVFLKQPNGTYTNTHEWCEEGITSQKNNLANVDLDTVSPGWVTALKTDGLIIAADIKELDPVSFLDLREQGIKAVAEFAIRQKGQLYAFVGFDDCKGVHHWSREEIQMLHTLTGIIAATLQRMQLEKQTVLQNERMISMLGTMDTYIYVSDPETNEVLFANLALEQQSLEPLIGKTCWQVLRQQNERCSFCPLPWLLENPGKSYRWEHYNEQLNAHFRIHDSLIPWEDGRLVHFQYALDITELKTYQLKLEEFASIDMLTHTLNRTNFLQQARLALREANLQQQPLALAFVDVDGLKAENDKNGHQAGDQLIQTVVASLRHNVRSTDLLGRYGGDEFLILFRNCTVQVADRSLDKAACQLARFDSPTGSIYSFTYGVADTTEFICADIESLLGLLIETADQRMLLNKQARKLQRQ